MKSLPSLQHCSAYPHRAHVTAHPLPRLCPGQRQEVGLVPSAPQASGNITPNPRREQGCPRSSHHRAPSSRAVSQPGKAACCSALPALHSLPTALALSFKTPTWAGARGKSLGSSLCPGCQQSSAHHLQKRRDQHPGKQQFLTPYIREEASHGAHGEGWVLLRQGEGVMAADIPHTTTASPHPPASTSSLCHTLADPMRSPAKAQATQHRSLTHSTKHSGNGDTSPYPPSFTRVPTTTPGLHHPP